MDELEISGKRYLSTRRAAKDHKYTSDYVGQLIRGGKVVGKKVGRSWYVEEESLNAYLSGESAPAPKVVKKEESLAAKPVEEAVKTAPIVAAAVEVKKEVIEEVPDEEKVSEEKIFEPVIVKPTTTEHHIPIRTSTPVKEKPMGGLRYVVDDEPALPNIQKKVFATTTTNVAPKKVEVEEVEADVEEVEIISNKKVGSFAIAGLVVAGLITLSLTALVSTTLNSRIVVEEGQVASVGYTFQ